MRTFDRIMIVALVLGVWALVLKPDVISAHGDHHGVDFAHSSHKHKCVISGMARGWAVAGHHLMRGLHDDPAGRDVVVRGWSGVKVVCF